MTDYTFETLNDKEFEVLVVDLLSEQFGKSIERFKPGRDQGIDGRFFEDVIDKKTIIQCKHWLKSGIDKLINECKRNEVAKVQKIDPSRYIFATSLPLSAKNKDDIFSAFKPYIQCLTDILGQEDLNSLLAKHPNIEKKHYKLYLTSVNILQTILANDVVGRSSFHLEEIQGFLPKYVQTENHKNAFEKLEELGSIIINGEPGIGKTTLAEQLCLEYVTRQYELVVVSESIKEAERVYSLDKKQIFYFDDFLGSNFLLALDNNQDSSIINFIRRVNKDSTKRFILTTRSNILNQGKFLSERFLQNNLNRNEYEIRIQSLKKMDKAKILYNHIYFSDLPETFIDEIYKNKRYVDIINHKNFNPRLIEFITDFIKVGILSEPSCYWDYIQQSLNNPKDIWRGTIENQIGDLDRHIVIAITLNNNSMKEDSLHSLLIRLKEIGFDVNNKFPTINSVMRRLAGSVLNRNILENKQISYSLFNPSIADFVISEYISRTDYIAKLIYCTRLSSTLLSIKKLSSSTISLLNYELIIESLVDIEVKTELKPDLYTFQLIESANNLSIDTSSLVSKVLIINIDDIYRDFGIITLKSFQIAIDLSLTIDINKVHLVIIDALSDADVDELKYITELISVVPNNSSLIEKYRKHAIEIFEEAITEWAIDDDRFSHHFDSNIMFDDDMYTYVDEILRDFECELGLTEEDKGLIAQSIDFGRIIERNIENDYNGERYAEEYRDHQSSEDSNGYNIDPIDDLFQRN